MRRSWTRYIFVCGRQCHERSFVYSKDGVFVIQFRRVNIVHLFRTRILGTRLSYWLSHKFNIFSGPSSIHRSARLCQTRVWPMGTHVLSFCSHTICSICLLSPCIEFGVRTCVQKCKHTHLVMFANIVQIPIKTIRAFSTNLHAIVRTPRTLDFPHVMLLVALFGIINMYDITHEMYAHVRSMCMPLYHRCGLRVAPGIGQHIYVWFAEFSLLTVRIWSRLAHTFQHATIE